MSRRFRLQRVLAERLPWASRAPRDAGLRELRPPCRRVYRLGGRQTRRRPRPGCEGLLQRAVSAGRGARSKADFAPRTVAGGAGAAEGGGCRGRDLSGGGVCSPRPEEAPGDMGRGSLPPGAGTAIARPWGEHRFRIFVQRKEDRALQVGERMKRRQRSERRRGTEGAGPVGPPASLLSEVSRRPWGVLIRGIRSRF